MENTTALRLDDSIFIVGLPFAKKDHFATPQKATIDGNIILRTGNFGKEYAVPIVSNGVKQCVSLWSNQIAQLAQRFGLDTAMWQGKEFMLGTTDKLNKMGRTVKAWTVQV